MVQTISKSRSGDRVNRSVIEAATSHILLIENDRQLAQLIAQELNCEGYHVSSMKDGTSRLLLRLALG